MSRGQGLGARRTPPESASVGYSPFRAETRGARRQDRGVRRISSRLGADHVALASRGV